MERMLPHVNWHYLLDMYGTANRILLYYYYIIKFLTVQRAQPAWHICHYLPDIYGRTMSYKTAYHIARMLYLIVDSTTGTTSQTYIYGTAVSYTAAYHIAIYQDIVFNCWQYNWHYEP